MSDAARPPAEAVAEVVLTAVDPLGPTIGFFTDLGFRVRTIVPADHPSMVRLEGHGLRLVLDVAALTGPGEIVLRSDTLDLVTYRAPNGTIVRVEPATPRTSWPPVEQDLVVSHLADHGAFGEGRAGMRYRDLIPTRLGGAFIASHILITDGGPVPDYVHYHHVRFQMIFCHRGWVKVLYEDQGEMITMSPGDCVLQPATIRHRVCEASDGMEVLEIGCPAIHETWADPDTELPTGRDLPDRGYGDGGHRFVFHVADDAPWSAWTSDGWECQVTAIASATDALADVRSVRASSGGAVADLSHDLEFSFLFIREGTLEVSRPDGAVDRLVPGDSINIPPGIPVHATAATAATEFVHVTLPHEC